MTLTPRAARGIRIWVTVACTIFGALLPFLIPGAVAVRFFTDAEARIGFGAFSVIIHALIGAVFGAGLAEFLVWSGGGAGDGRFGGPRQGPAGKQSRRDARHR